MPDEINVAKSSDFTFELFVLSGTGDPAAPFYEIVLTDNALLAATTLNIKPLDWSFHSGDMFMFTHNFVVVLNADANPRDTTLTVLPLGAVLNAGEVGKLIQDLTGYTIECEVLDSAGDATPKISFTGGDIVLSDQTTTAGRGRAQISGVVADTQSLVAKTYYGAVWRRNSGSSRPLKEFDFKLKEEGFL